MTKYLLNEIDELLQNNIISDVVAKNIKLYYSNKDAQIKENKLPIVFGVLGALLGGLGIILILAHNWDNFSIATKSVISFFPLIIGQMACTFSLLKKNNNATWNESSATFLFFAVAATISLIAQIYNLPEDFNGFLQIWLLLTLPLIYIMQSRVVSLIYILVLTVYGTYTNINFFEKHNYLYFIFLIAVLPFYFIQLKNKFNSNLTYFHHWFIALSLTIVLSNYFKPKDLSAIIAYFSMYSIFYSIGKFKGFKTLPSISNAYWIVGKLGTLFLLFLLSFKWFWTENYTYLPTLFSLESGLAILLFTVAFYLLFNNYHKNNYFFRNPIPYAFIMISLFILMISKVNEIVPVIFINLLVLCIGIYEIINGNKKDSLLRVNFGLIIISILIACRFFDTNMSFVVRGILFISIGIGFFAFNYYLLNKRKNGN